MKTRRNVLLLFSKLPEAGLVKTRLTTERGGMFTPEDAARLYEAMLLDVVSACLAGFSKCGGGADGGAFDGDRSFDDAYELVVSCAPTGNIPAMRELLEREFGPLDGEGVRFPVKVIGDVGATFDEHYNDAFTQCWESGADCILSMGADMPALTAADVVRGFEALHSLAGDDGCGQGIVLAPDQEMGVSIIGWTRATDFDHTGVFYNPTGLTVLPAYVEKAREGGLAALYLPPVPDVDTMADLMHNVTLVGALEYCTRFDGGSAPERTLAVLRDLGCDEVRVPPNDLMDPRGAIDE